MSITQEDPLGSYMASQSRKQLIQIIRDEALSRAKLQEQAGPLLRRLEHLGSGDWTELHTDLCIFLKSVVEG